MRVQKETLDEWRARVALYIRNLGYGNTVDDVRSPSCAWAIAHRTGIPQDAYRAGCHDSHIETALKRIFPNAWTKDVNDEAR